MLTAGLGAGFGFGDAGGWRCADCLLVVEPAALLRLLRRGRKVVVCVVAVGGVVGTVLGLLRRSATRWGAGWSLRTCGAGVASAALKFSCAAAAVGACDPP